MIGGVLISKWMLLCLGLVQAKGGQNTYLAEPSKNIVAAIWVQQQEMVGAGMKRSQVKKTRRVNNEEVSKRNSDTFIRNVYSID